MTSAPNLESILEAQKTKEIVEDVRHRYALRRALLNTATTKSRVLSWSQVFYWLTGGAVGVSLAVVAQFLFLPTAGEEIAPMIEPVLVQNNPVINISTASEINKNIPIDSMDLYSANNNALETSKINLVNAP